MNECERNFERIRIGLCNILLLMSWQILILGQLPMQIGLSPIWRNQIKFSKAAQKIYFCCANNWCETNTQSCWIKSPFSSKTHTIFVSFSTGYISTPKQTLEYSIVCVFYVQNNEPIVHISHTMGNANQNSTINRVARHHQQHSKQPRVLGTKIYKHKRVHFHCYFATITTRLVPTVWN